MSTEHTATTARARDATRALRRAVERPTGVLLWGQPRRTTPRLVDRVFGNGRALIQLGPIRHRPRYYVVRIDDGWHLNTYERLPDHPFRRPWPEEQTLRGHLDEIYEAIIDQFGGGSRFPAFARDNGHEWFAMPWPNGLVPVPPAAGRTRRRRG